MALTIVVRSGARPEAHQITFDTPRLVIGRGEGCEIRLPDPSVSHRHASIRQRGTEYIVVDEGSTNGTFVGPVRLSPQAPRVVKQGDLIRVGRIWLEARLEQAVPTQNSAAATKELALALVAEALAAQGEPSNVRVVAQAGPGKDAELCLTEFEKPYIIGRGKRAHLTIEDDDLSRRHLQLVLRAERVFVTDLGSKNGSQLGTEPLQPNKETLWPPGTPLVVGAQTFTLDHPARDALTELDGVADEKIAPGEAIAPPDPQGDDVDDLEPSESGTRIDGSPTLGEAPLAPRPRASRRPPKTGWRATDYLIALFALGVLAVSVAGLVWLIGQ